MALRLSNHSPIPNPVLTRLVNWVLTHLANDVPDTLVTVSRDSQDGFAENYGVMVGAAYPMGGWKLKLDRQHVIEIAAPKETLTACFPVVTQQPGGPLVHFEDWQEEFVHTLAHELHHLSLFEAKKEWRGDDAEVECERYAWAVTQSFRLNKGNAI
jgi:hypothetical protein